MSNYWKDWCHGKFANLENGLYIVFRTTNNNNDPLYVLKHYKPDDDNKLDIHNPITILQKDKHNNDYQSELELELGRGNDVGDTGFVKKGEEYIGIYDLPDNDKYNNRDSIKNKLDNESTINNFYEHGIYDWLIADAIMEHMYGAEVQETREKSELSKQITKMEHSYTSEINKLTYQLDALSLISDLTNEYFNKNTKQEQISLILNKIDGFNQNNSIQECFENINVNEPKKNKVVRSDLKENEIYTEHFKYVMVSTVVSIYNEAKKDAIHFNILCDAMEKYNIDNNNYPCTKIGKDEFNKNGTKAILEKIREFYDNFDNLKNEFNNRFDEFVNGKVAEQIQDMENGNSTLLKDMEEKKIEAENKLKKAEQNLSSLTLENKKNESSIDAFKKKIKENEQQLLINDKEEGKLKQLKTENDILSKQIGIMTDNINNNGEIISKLNNTIDEMNIQQDIAQNFFSSLFNLGVLVLDDDNSVKISESVSNIEKIVNNKNKNDNDAIFRDILELLEVTKMDELTGHINNKDALNYHVRAILKKEDYQTYIKTVYNKGATFHGAFNNTLGKNALVDNKKHKNFIDYSKDSDKFETYLNNILNIFNSNLKYYFAIHPTFYSNNSFNAKTEWGILLAKINTIVPRSTFLELFDVKYFLPFLYIDTRYEHWLKYDNWTHKWAHEPYKMNTIIKKYNDNFHINDPNLASHIYENLKNHSYYSKKDSATLDIGYSDYNFMHIADVIKMYYYFKKTTIREYTYRNEYVEVIKANLVGYLNGLSDAWRPYVISDASGNFQKIDDVVTDKVILDTNVKSKIQSVNDTKIMTIVKLNNYSGDLLKWNTSYIPFTNQQHNYLKLIVNNNFHDASGNEINNNFHYFDDNKQYKEYTFGGFSKLLNPNQFKLNDNNKTKNPDIEEIMNTEQTNTIKNQIEDGKNVFIFGYGASGAGKTAMLVYNNNKKLPGYTYSLCEKFILIKNNKETLNQVDDKSFYLNIIEYDNKHNDGKTVYPETDPTTTTTLDTLVDILKKYVTDVNGNRNIKATRNNTQSSRSHILMEFDFDYDFAERTPNPARTKFGKLYIADLAGVENPFDPSDCKTISQTFNNIEEWESIRTTTSTLDSISIVGSKEDKDALVDTFNKKLLIEAGNKPINPYYQYKFNNDIIDIKVPTKSNTEIIFPDKKKVRFILGDLSEDYLEENTTVYYVESRTNTRSTAPFNPTGILVGVIPQLLLNASNKEETEYLDTRTVSISGKPKQVYGMPFTSVDKWTAQSHGLTPTSFAIWDGKQLIKKYANKIMTGKYTFNKAIESLFYKSTTYHISNISNIKEMIDGYHANEINNKFVVYRDYDVPVKDGGKEFENEKVLMEYFITANQTLNIEEYIKGILTKSNRLPLHELLNTIYNTVDDNEKYIIEKYSKESNIDDVIEVREKLQKYISYTVNEIQERTNEGEYINRELSNLRKDMLTSIYYKSDKSLFTCPNVESSCLSSLCSTTDNKICYMMECENQPYSTCNSYMMSKIIGTNENNFKNTTIVVFTVFNISEKIQNNSEECAFIDSNYNIGSGNYYTESSIYIDIKTIKDAEMVYNKDKNKTNKEKLMTEIIKLKDFITNTEHTSIRNDSNRMSFIETLKKFVNAGNISQINTIYETIDKHNASTPLGTLIFTDNIAKFGTFDEACYTDTITAIHDKDYTFSVNIENDDFKTDLSNNFPPQKKRPTEDT